MTGRARYVVSRLVVVCVAVAWTVAVNALVAAPAARAAGVIGTTKPDSYSVLTGHLLPVAAPGVLGNDTVLGGSATAQLRSDVRHGTLTLDTDGGFRYQPAAGFIGIDTFTYRMPGGLLLLLPSNTSTVTITVTAPPPPPTPSPTPTPKPTATPTPTPAPTATPRPTSTPTPRSTSHPTLPPLPTLLPLPTSLIPTPTPVPTPSSSARPSASPTATPRSDSGLPGGPPAGGGTTGGGPTAGPTTAPAPTPAFGDADTFAIPDPNTSSGVQLDPGSITFSSFDWAVPALALSVPGLLLVLAVAVEALIGLAWIPVARRWIGEDEPQRRRRRRAGAF